MTLALGIDPGIATTGYGLVRLEADGGLVPVKYGVILTPKEDDGIQVQLLRSIVKAMSQKATQAAITKAKSGEEIWRHFQEAFTAQQVVRK